MKIGEVHPIYGKCCAMGCRDGEPYRMFVDKVGGVSLIPLDALELIQNEHII